MYAVGGNHHVGLGRGAVGECNARGIAVLLEAHGAVAGVHDARRQVGSKELNKVGAVHAEARVPGGVRHLHRRDWRAIVAKVV